MVQRCAYYLSATVGVLRMDLQELEPAGPYRLIVDGAAEKHIEYFDDSQAALDRWEEFDAVMRPAFAGSARYGLASREGCHAEAFSVQKRRRTH